MLVVELDFVFEEVFEAVPSLKFVGICRAATSHVDIEAAFERRAGSLWSTRREGTHRPLRNTRWG